MHKIMCEYTKNLIEEMKIKICCVQAGNFSQAVMLYFPCQVSPHAEKNIMWGTDIMKKILSKK